MTYRDDMVAAHRAGRTAKLGDRNPYADTGRHALAGVWLLGYRAMLLDRVNLTVERQALFQSPNGDD